MTNFSFLQTEKDFETFSAPAIAAEQIFHIDPAACVINCRRAMEFAVKWMYSVDKQSSSPSNAQQCGKLEPATSTIVAAI